MQIGFDLQVLASNRAGTAVYVKNLFAALQRVDRNNRYIQFKANYRLPRKNLFTKIGNGVLELLHTNFLSPLQAALAEVDLVHYPANIVPIAALSPTVVTIYDMIFRHFPVGYDPLYLSYIQLFFPMAARRANRIITLSESSKQDIVKYCNVPEKKVKVIYPGVADDFGLVDKIRAQSFIMENYRIGQSPFIVFIGETGPRKNLENLVKGFSLLRQKEPLSDFHLLLIGDQRDTRYLQKLITLIGSERLERVVHMLGFVPREHLKYILSAARAVVYISLCEGFGFPIIEAMACGTPVMSSNVSSMPEVMGDAGILVDPYNIEEISEGMRKILLDEKLREDLISLGLKRVKVFKWENTALETISVYEEIMQEKKNMSR